MQIYLLRHGAAEDSAGIPDEQRRLTAAGRQAVRTVLERARAAGLTPSLILASPLLRARETAELAAGLFPAKPEILCTRALLPSAAPEELWEEVRRHRGREQLLLAGHEPLLSRAISYLLGAPAVQVEMRKAALARIELERLDPHPRGLLRWLLPPELAGGS